MTKYYLNKILLLVAVMSAVVSCVSVDDTLGENFIPNEQVMAMRIDSSFVIKTYNVTTDSVRADGLSSNYLGSYVDPMTGSVNAEIIFQMAPPYFPNSEGFGNEFVIDSLSMILSVNGVMGNSDVEQIFEVYELEKGIFLDSVYYTDFDPSTVAKQTPLFTFKHSGKAEYISHKIEDPNLITRLMDTTGYSVDTIFHDRFKGFYIRSSSAHSSAAVYNISLGNSYIIANYHNKKVEPDTSVVLYRFSPNTSTFFGYNQNINVINYDYTHASPDLRIDDKTTPVATTIVQGYGGLSTYLEFTQESVNDIKKKITDNGYSQIAINKAKLEIGVNNHAAESMDEAFKRLGMYTNFKKMENIPDYDYMSESDYGYTLSYGGYINRSRFIYEMDITQYVQRLFRDEYDLRGVTVGPGVDAFYSLRHVELEGFGSKIPIRLILTYTMVK